MGGETFLNKYWKIMLTVNGIPKRDSLPNDSSGNDTPISDIAICADDIPVMDPIQPDSS